MLKKVRALECGYRDKYDVLYPDTMRIHTTYVTPTRYTHPRVT